MNTKYIVIAAAASLLSACSLYSSDGKDRCEDQSHCLNGFVCNQATGVCEPTAKPDGGGPCVDCGNDAAFVGSAFAVTEVGTAVTLNILDNSIAVPGDPLTVVATGQPANGTASLKPDGSATYTPDAGFVGIDSFEVTVADRAGSHAGTLTILVREPLATTETMRRVQRVAYDRATISGDGRYIAFTSRSHGIVPGDTNGDDDIFILDRVTDTVTRASVSSDGAQSENHSSQPTISMDGRFVAFTSLSGNLVPDDINGDGDVFVRDLQTGAVELVSQSSDGTQGNRLSDAPWLSADGRFVAFVSTSGNLADGAVRRRNLFLRDRERGTTTLITGPTAGTPTTGDVEGHEMSADGRFIALVLNPARHNGDGTGSEAPRQVWIHDTSTGRSRRVPGEPVGALLSADGRWLGRDSSPFVLTDLIDGGDEAVIYSADGVTQPTASASSLSGDRRFVTFGSRAGTLVAGDSNGESDAFVRDIGAGVNYRVSVSADGMQYDRGSGSHAVSTDGRWILFRTDAQNVDPDAADHTWDLFVAANPAAD